MNQDEATHVAELTREECLHLLQDQAYVGRIGLVVDGRPLVLPVNYLAESDAIIFCTGSGTKLDAARNGVDVAFEVDDSRPLQHAGWSVVIQGKAHEITGQDEIEKLRRGPLKSWVAAPSQHWVRISLETISGRRIH